MSNHNAFRGDGFDSLRRQLHSHMKSKHAHQHPNDTLPGMEQKHAAMHAEKKQDHPSHSREVKNG